MPSELFLYTDSSGTARAVSSFQEVPQKYHARVKRVYSEAPEPEFKKPELTGPFVETVLPLAALIIAWRRYQGFMMRTALAVFVCFWIYNRVADKVTGLGDFQAQLAKPGPKGGPLPMDGETSPLGLPVDPNAPEPPLSGIDENGFGRKPR